MKKVIITVGLIISGYLGGLAQDLPIEVPAGTQPEISFPLDINTVIISETQYDNTIELVEEHRLCEQQVEQLQLKTEILENINVQADSIRQIVEQGYNHYAGKWEMTQEDLTQEKLKVSKWKGRTWQIGLGSLVVGLLLGTQI